MARRRPYFERGTLERAKTNLRKTAGLFEKREYAMTVVRAVTVVELFLDGILEDRLRLVFASPKLVGAMLRRLTFEEKHSLLMKELFGFSLAEMCEDEVRALPAIRRERNDIVHRGTFSKWASAERAMNVAFPIVKKVNRALTRRKG